FAEFVEREDLIVADVRLKPASRLRGWSAKALSVRLGDRYTWIRELGNLNYQGGPVALQDEAVGLAKLRELLHGPGGVLLCVGSDVANWHRTVVTNALARDVEIRHWPAEGR